MDGCPVGVELGVEVLVGVVVASEGVGFCDVLLSVGSGDGELGCGVGEPALWLRLDVGVGVGVDDVERLAPPEPPLPPPEPWFVPVIGPQKMLSGSV